MKDKVIIRKGKAICPRCDKSYPIEVMMTPSEKLAVSCPNCKGKSGPKKTSTINEENGDSYCKMLEENVAGIERHDHVPNNWGGGFVVRI